MPSEEAIADAAFLFEELFVSDVFAYADVAFGLAEVQYAG